METIDPLGIQKAMENLWRQCIDSPNRPDCIFVSGKTASRWRRIVYGRSQPYKRLRGVRGRKKSLSFARQNHGLLGVVERS